MPAGTMSEPRANPSRAEENAALPPPSHPEPSSPNTPVDDAAASLLDGLAAPTDDSPTVISKAPPKGLAAEDTFAGGLRGRRLAHFELIEPIGVGGMAAVLQARDTQLDRLVALKILPPDMAADEENVRRFHQEARSAAKLDHENIARVFFCGEDQRLHFIAFEFVEGDNLRVMLEKRGRLPAAESLHYLLQVAAGLAHAARRGVVHRDIKPSNIIVTPGGRAKLVDMGLARSLGKQNDDGLTQSGVTLGTFDYISPEQALEPREADVRSDLYSLGCTFYHVLTGQPPVPDGTAAKKLHHHQHVKPPDPRELAPDLPDEVAAVLDRMMAKAPEQRYQTPEQLLHHLLLAARAVGVAPEAPESLLLAEAALPAPPAGRPLLLAGLATLAVVALVLFADLSGTQSKTDQLTPINKDADVAQRSPTPTESRPDQPPKLLSEKPPKPSPVPPIGAVARFDAEEPTAAKLAAWAAEAARNRAETLEVLLAADLTVQVGDDGLDPGLVLSAKKVTIKPKYAGKRPTITLSHRGQFQKDKETWTALTVVGDEVAVEGLRFVLDARGANVEMAGLRLNGGRQQLVKDCEFVQVLPFFDKTKRVASLLARAESGRAALRLEECCFLGYVGFDVVTQPTTGQSVYAPVRVDRGGQDAVVRRGAVQLTAVNCAFGPHAAAFRFEGAPAAEDGRALIRHCSLLAGAESAALELAEMAGAELQVEACLFSRPAESGAGMGNGARAATLLRQAAPAGLVAFRGADNRYHNLDAWWSSSDGRDATDVADFRRKLQETSGADVRARLLEENPWNSVQPLKLLEQPPPAQPALAFRPNVRLAELRLPGVPTRETVAGVERIGDVVFSADLPPLTTPRIEPLARKERTVDPTAAEDPTNGLYKKLEQAVLAAEPGDIVLIRHKGRLRVGPMRLEKATTDLTIRPAPGYRPELVLADAREVDAALFHVHDGKLRLEGLEFRLQPDDDFRSQAVVALTGSAQCTLKGCAITLDPSGYGTTLAVATIADAAGAKMDPKPREGAAAPCLG